MHYSLFPSVIRKLFFKNLVTPFVILVLLLGKSLVGYAFLVSSYHDSQYQLQIALHHSSGEWITQHFDEQSVQETLHLQFLGLYKHQNYLYYLVYDFAQKALKFLIHPENILQDNYKNPVSAQKKITLTSLIIKSNYGGDENRLAFTDDKHASFETAKSGEYVIVYDKNLLLWSRINHHTHFEGWNTIDLASSGLQMITAKIHQGENHAYIVTSHTTSSVNVNRYKVFKFTLNLPDTDSLLFDNQDCTLTLPHIVYFDQPKQCYCLAGPMRVVKSERHHDFTGNYYTGEYQLFYQGGIGRVFLPNDSSSYCLTDSQPLVPPPYNLFLNTDKKDYNFISLKDGYIGLFNTRSTDTKPSVMILHSVVGGTEQKVPLTLNQGAKRSKIIMGDSRSKDSQDRFIVVNNNTIYSSNGKNPWTKWANSLPHTENFQDVVWLD